MTSLPFPRTSFVVLGALAALGLLVLLPGVALADNCSSLGDCWRSAGGAAGTAVGVGVAAGVAGGVGNKNGGTGKTGGKNGDKTGKDAPKGGGAQRYQGPPGYHGPHPEYGRNPSGTPGEPGYDPGTFKSGAPAPRLPPPRGYYKTHPIDVDTSQIKADDPDEGMPPHAIRG